MRLVPTHQCTAFFQDGQTWCKNLYYSTKHTFNTHCVSHLSQLDKTASLGVAALPARPFTLVRVVQSIPICSTRYFTLCIAHKHLQTVVFQLLSLLPLSCLRFSRDAKPFLILPSLFPYISASTPWFRWDVSVLNKRWLSFSATYTAAAAIAHTLQASQLPIFEEKTCHHLPEFFLWPTAAKQSISASLVQLATRDAKFRTSDPNSGPAGYLLLSAKQSRNKHSLAGCVRCWKMLPTLDAGLARFGKVLYLAHVWRLNMARVWEPDSQAEWQVSLRWLKNWLSDLLISLLSPYCFDLLTLS